MTIFYQYLALSPFRQKTGVYDRQTDRRSGILPRHSPRYAYASRGKTKKSRMWYYVAAHIDLTAMWFFCCFSCVVSSSNVVLNC